MAEVLASLFVIHIVSFTAGYAACVWRHRL